MTKRISSQVRKARDRYKASESYKAQTAWELSGELGFEVIPTNAPSTDEFSLKLTGLTTDQIRIVVSFFTKIVKGDYYGTR